MIEDTSFVIDVPNGDEGALELVSIAEAERRPETVSSVTLLELHEGIGQSTRPDEPIDREDCIVAATALREDEPVVTRNVDHLERVPDVRVREY